MGGEIYDQQEPALIIPGPVVLVAGPGSGKTTKLAQRIKYLIEDRGVSPDEIIVITFSVEAARHMKKVLTTPEKEAPNVTLLPERHPQLIRTMHSLGRSIIAESGARSLQRTHAVFRRSSSLAHPILDIKSAFNRHSFLLDPAGAESPASNLS